MTRRELEIAKAAATAAAEAMMEPLLDLVLRLAKEKRISAEEVADLQREMKDREKNIQKYLPHQR